jgi:PST family polysaccharide transporter/lipopolysaccharide exporter
LIQLVISRNLGVAALGLYALAGKLALLPNQVATDVVGSVAFPLYSRLQDDRKSVGEAFRGFLTGTAFLLLPVYAIIIGLAPDLVEHVLGPRWQGSASIIQVLAIMGIVGLFGDTVGPLLKGLGHPRKTVQLVAVQTVVVIAVVGELAVRFGAVGAACAWIPGVAASQLLASYYVIKLVPGALSDLGRPLIGVFFASTAAAALSMGTARAFPGAIGSISAAILSGLVALGLLWWLDRRFALGFSEALPKIFPRLAILFR